MSPIGANSTRWAIWPAVVSVPTRVGPDRQLALAKHGRREGRLALAARHRQAFPVMVFWSMVGRAFDDFAVDRDHFAGIDDDEITDRELRRRDRNDLAVTQDPGDLRAEFQQFADGASRPGRGQVADPVAELDQPRHQRAGERIGLQAIGSRDRKRVEEIDIQAPFIAPHAPGPPRDRDAFQSISGMLTAITTDWR